MQPQCAWVGAYDALRNRAGDVVRWARFRVHPAARARRRVCAHDLEVPRHHQHILHSGTAVHRTAPHNTAAHRSAPPRPAPHRTAAGSCASCGCCCGGCVGRRRRHASKWRRLFLMSYTSHRSCSSSARHCSAVATAAQCIGRRNGPLCGIPRGHGSTRCLPGALWDHASGTAAANDHTIEAAERSGGGEGRASGALGACDAHHQPLVVVQVARHGLHVAFKARMRACKWDHRPATSAPGLRSLLPHLHRDCACCCHICTGTALSCAAHMHVCTQTGRVTTPHAERLRANPSLALLATALNTLQHATNHAPCSATDELSPQTAWRATALAEGPNAQAPYSRNRPDGAARARM